MIDAIHSLTPDTTRRNSGQAATNKGRVESEDHRSIIRIRGGHYVSDSRGRPSSPSSLPLKQLQDDEEEHEREGGKDRGNSFCCEVRKDGDRPGRGEREEEGGGGRRERLLGPAVGGASHESDGGRDLSEKDPT